MKRSISILLTTLLFSVPVLPAVAYPQSRGATPTSFNPYVSNQMSANPISPFNLAYLAYQGYLKDQGIPSSGGLSDAITAGTLTAQDVMQAAVKANQLPEQILSDRNYRSALEAQLQGLTED